MNLDQLLETVRSRVDVLVVLATETIWWRPWCAGEIVAAYLADVPIILVMMNGVEVALDACDSHFKEQLQYDGAKLKVGRVVDAMELIATSSGVARCLLCGLVPIQAIIQRTRAAYQS